MNSLTQAEPATPCTFAPLLVETDGPTLSPAQQRSFEKLDMFAREVALVSLCGGPGSGKSTVLRAFARKYGGRIIGYDDFAPAVALRDTRLTSNAVVECIEQIASDHDLLIVEDVEALTSSFSGVRGAPNQNIDGALFRHLFDTLVQAGKRLLVGVTADKGIVHGLFGTAQLASVELESFNIADYACIVGNILGAERAGRLDFKLIYRYASLLNGHELRSACQVISQLPAPTTEQFVAGLENYVLSSNIRIEEIEALTFDSLPGAGHITARLETQVILPLEHRELAQRLGLKPKRGVLLYGPPGTGKTSIGRALAHRMKGKFFLIDGSIVTEPPGAFFDKLNAVIREAKESAPSVLFIDDADVLFGIVHISGLARYLLTLLDGLESESASHVCVMMTAMDVRRVPEALLRSGRVELWLETRAPVGADRGRVLQRWLGQDLPAYDTVDYAGLSEATEGFTPADLRRITADAKCLYAADQVKGRPTATANEYLQRAVASLVAIRGRMTDALGDERLRVARTKDK